jgi:hypothetical protein
MTFWQWLGARVLLTLLFLIITLTVGMIVAKRAERGKKRS